MRKLGLLSLIVFGAVIGTVFSGCGDDEPTQQTTDKAKVMFFHAAEDVQRVDLQFGTAMFALDRTYTDFTTYLDVNAGSVDAKLVTAGTSTALARKTLSFEKDKRYTLFAVNDATGNADLVLFTDDLTTPAAGKARIRVAHMIPDGPVIKVAIMQVGPFAENVAFKDNAQSFHEVTAGSLTIRVQDQATGGNGSGGQGPMLEDSFIFEAGKSYTLIARGKLSDTTAELFLLPHSTN